MQIHNVSYTPWHRLHTSRMSLSEDVDLEEFVMAKDDLSGADIKAVCTEAGLLALRERRMRVTKADFTSAREKVHFPSDNALEGFIILLHPGPVPEERGHTRGPLSLVVGVCSTLDSYCNETLRNFIVWIPEELYQLTFSKSARVRRHVHNASTKLIPYGLSVF